MISGVSWCEGHQQQEESNREKGNRNNGWKGLREKNLNRTWKLKSGILVFESMKGIQLFLTS